MKKRLWGTLAILLWTTASWATDHALLIGVADYPYLPKRLWLQGPINDVALMKTVLQERGFHTANTTTLVSRSTSAQAPTRTNILQAFDTLRNAVHPGDRVFFYLAGHGSQQPQPLQHLGRPTEADGLDEVFLPADVRSWDGTGAQATIPNALLDDEIGEWMDSLVDAGATVWGVFDTCHAAGMARGAGGTRYRAIDPVELGLPMTRGPASKRKPVPASPPPLAAGTNDRVDGRSLAFAARGHEATAEEWLPRGAPMSQVHKQGVFTYHLAQQLRSGVDGSTDLPRAISHAYAKESRVNPVPQWVNVAKINWP